ncbi:MAG: Imm1 family immunity protein [Gemmataceae bacterium]
MRQSLHCVARLADIYAVRDLDSIKDAFQAMRVRDSRGCNSFWIKRGDSEYPQLAVLVKDDLACVHHFPRVSEAGYQSVGEAGTDKTTTFFISSGNDEVEVLNSAIVPFAVALKAVEYFLHTGDRLPLMDWLEL